MLFNGQFISSFVFTLCTVGVLATLLGIGYATYRARGVLHSISGWFCRRIVLPVHQTIARVSTALACVWSLAINSVTFLLVHSGRTFVRLIIMLASIFPFREVRWDIGFGVLVAIAFPFLAFAFFGLPLQSIFGILAAGTLIGAFCAPFTVWYYRTLGTTKAIGLAFLTIVGGAYGSSLLIIMLLVMTQD